MAISLCRNYGNNADKILHQKQLREIKKEIFRKTIHLCTAFVPFFLDRFYWITMLLLFFVLVGYIVCEILRLNGIIVPIISKVTDIASRKRDENHFVLGPVTLASGVLITALFFPSLAAKIGILSLALGDGLASLFGKLFGHILIPFTSGKTVAGSLTCFMAIFVSSYLCYQNLICALTLGVAGMIIEVFPIKNFDNITLPILIAFISLFFIY